MNMVFGGNKTPVEVIKEGAFRGTYFIDIYSGVNRKWYRKAWEEFNELKNIKIVIAQIIMMLVLIDIKLNVEHH